MVGVVRVESATTRTGRWHTCTGGIARFSTWHNALRPVSRTDSRGSLRRRYLSGLCHLNAGRSCALGVEQRGRRRTLALEHAKMQQHQHYRGTTSHPLGNAKNQRHPANMENVTQHGRIVHGGVRAPRPIGKIHIVQDSDHDVRSRSNRRCPLNKSMDRITREKRKVGYHSGAGARLLGCIGMKFPIISAGLGGKRQWFPRLRDRGRHTCRRYRVLS
jgi:hypothetical protein